MNNVTTFDNFPPFATNGRRNMNTESAKYAVGFLEGETFPAEWANYLFHGATKGISDLNTAVQSIWKENINVIQGSGQTPSSSDNTQLKTAIELMIQNAVLTANSQVLAQAKLDAHPVGSLYLSSNPTNPSTLFGGTWVQIKNRFIWAKGDSDTINATGGSKTVTLSVNNLPSHSHYYTPRGSVGSHHHGLNNHTHSFSGTTGSVGAKYGSANTGGMSGNSVGTFYAKSLTRVWGNPTGSISTMETGRQEYENSNSNTLPIRYKINVAHTHNFDHQHDFSGTTAGSNANTTDIQPSFTGTRAQTENTGSGAAVTIMPPYVVKYCWERVS